MPPIETIDLHQRAVLWPKIGDDDQGEVVVGVPVEIPVRWQRRRAESLDSKGTLIALEGFVVVDRVVPEGSILWEGTLEDWYGSGSAGGDGVDLRQVATVRDSPDIKGQVRRRVLGVVLFRDTLPT